MALSGCAASVESVHLEDLGERAHRVSVHAISMRNREVDAFVRAQAEAERRCGRDRMVPRATGIVAGAEAGLPSGTVVLGFQCLDEQDPRLRRPAPVPAPPDRG